jgi:hypothetical protein
MTDTKLFYRDGRAFTGRPLLSEKSGAPYTTHLEPCTRCGGAGGSSKWDHTGWACFDCRGSGKGREAVDKLYSAEKLAQLNATKEKSDARKAAKRALLESARAAEAAKRRTAFVAEMLPLFSLITAVLPKDNEFIDTMVTQSIDRATISERQIEVIENAWVRARIEEERAEARAVSQHVGEVGKRITVKGSVRYVHTMSVDSFRGYGSDTLYIVTIAGEDGNTYLYKGNKGYRFGEKDTPVSVVASVKEHNEYKGEKQTVIARPKFNEEMANG